TLAFFDYPIFIVVNSSRQAQKYFDLIDVAPITGIIIDDYEVVENKKLRSPLIGLYSALKELNTLNFKYAFILSCDNPFIQKSFIEHMIHESSELDGCVPIWKNYFIEPLLSIYRVQTFLNKCMDNLQKEDYKLSHLLDPRFKINFISIEGVIKKLDTHLLSFININKNTDLEKIISYI
ncbi:MAG: NTP transferase domain-containing protein, partial [Candidatus Lokiarchaeota archaeon]